MTTSSQAKAVHTSQFRAEPIVFHLGGAIFADVEKGHSTWDGVWWAVTTMATVGYGDLAPKTVVGRLVGIALMFIGIGFFALVTGAVAQRFLSADVREIEEAEHELARVESDTREQVLAELRDLAAPDSAIGAGGPEAVGELLRN